MKYGVNSDWDINQGTCLCLHTQTIISFMLVIFNLFYCWIMPPSANSHPEGAVMGSDCLKMQSQHLYFNKMEEVFLRMFQQDWSSQHPRAPSWLHTRWCNCHKQPLYTISHWIKNPRCHHDMEMDDGGPNDCRFGCREAENIALNPFPPTLGWEVTDLLGTASPPQVSHLTCSYAINSFFPGIK